MLSTDDMALEGWVYQKIDEVIKKSAGPPFLSIFFKLMKLPIYSMNGVGEGYLKDWLFI